MAMIPRYLLKGLGVTAYDSGVGGGRSHSPVISSEYDPETKTFGRLGTVFSISAQGYDDFMESEASDPYQEAVDNKFSGASRICVYAAGGYPLQIEAIIGFTTSGYIRIWHGGYPAAGTAVSYGGVDLPPTETTSRFYVTPIYIPETETVQFAMSTRSTFERISDAWPILFATVEKTDSDGAGGTIDWIMSKVTAVPYDAGITYLQGLPSSVLEPDSTGETGIIIGAEAHYVSGSGDEITEEIVDISDQATYEIINSAGWLDENRQLIIAEWATNVGIVVTWDGMPGEVAQIAVVVGGWDNDTGDDDTGGGSGGDTGDGGDTGGGTGGDDSGGGDTGDDDSGGSGDDTGDGTTGTVSVEALREAFMQGMATMAALYSRWLKPPVACLYNDARMPVLPVWNRKKYPYAAAAWTTSLGAQNVGYVTLAYLYLSTVPLTATIGATHRVYATAPGSMIMYNLGTGTGLDAWVRYDTGDVENFEQGEEVHSNSMCYVRWANYDIEITSNYTDTTRVLSASEPIPIYE